MALPTRTLLLVIAYLGFISLGLPDTLIGVAWPSIRDTFQQPQSAAALIFFCTGLSYFFSSFFTGKLLRMMGTGALLGGSTLLVAFGMGGYAISPAWLLLGVFAIMHGLGSGAIDAGLNHHAAHHFSARHMNWLHACYSLGATAGSFIMATVISMQFPWRSGYGMIAIALGTLALAFLFTRKLWNNGEATTEEQTEVSASSVSDALRDGTVQLQCVIFFFYTGLEIALGQWCYTLLIDARAWSESIAGAAVTTYWASIFVGRVVFGSVVAHLGIDRFIRWSIAGSLLGILLVALSTAPALVFIGLALSGLGLATIYPCLMTRTPQRIGPALTGHAIGFQVSAAMLGGAAIPSIAGWLSRGANLEALIWTPAAVAALLWLLHEGLLLGDRSRLPKAEQTIDQSKLE